VDTEDQTNPTAEHAAPPAAPGTRPRPSWFMRWGKGTALWLCGFGVGAAVVYGALWGKAEYDSYHALQAMHLPPPEPVRQADHETAKLFAPEQPPVAAPVTPAVAAAAVAAPVVAEKAVAPASKPVRIAKTSRSKIAATPVKARTQLAANTKARKSNLVSTRQSVRLADRRAAPRVLEIRRSSVARDLRRPCRRGDLARECYVVR
jgi:hypothetical protein